MASPFRFLRTTVLLAASALALGACGQAGPNRTPQAGRYEISVKVTRFDVPGLDAPKLHAMQQALIGSESKSTYCLSSDAADDQAEALFEQIGEGDCSLHDFAPRKGQVDVLMTCRALSGRQSFHLTGSLNGKGAHVLAEGIVTNRRFPQGQATLSREVTMKLIAECTPVDPAKKKKKDKGKDKDKGKSKAPAGTMG